MRIAIHVSTTKKGGGWFASLAGGGILSLRPLSPWWGIWKRLRKQKTAVVGLGIVAIFVLVGILAPLIAPGRLDVQDLAQSLRSPSRSHLLGTDDLGRDVLVRVIYGARTSLFISFVAVSGSVVAGSTLGLVAGHFGRWIDAVISRFFDILLAFPEVLLAIAIVTILGPGLMNGLIAIAIVGVPTYGRVIRSRVISIQEEEYIAAAEVMGAGHARVILRHVLPNSVSPAIVQGTLGVGKAVLFAASLGFLGLGAQPPTPEWGAMIAESHQYLITAYWTVLFPGLAILFTVFGYNLFGDGLRDALDPRLKQ